MWLSSRSNIVERRERADEANADSHIPGDIRVEDALNHFKKDTAVIIPPFGSFNQYK